MKILVPFMILSNIAYTNVQSKNVQSFSDKFNHLLLEVKKSLINSREFVGDIYSLKSDEKSFNLFLAKSLYHSDAKQSFTESIDLLWKYIKDDDFPYEAWHYLGLNYGKLQKYDLSSYALAEKYLLVNQLDNAKMHIKRVKQVSKDKILLNKIIDLEKEIKKRENK